MRIPILLLSSVLLLVSGQILWKFGLMKIGDFSINSPHFWHGLFGVFTSYYIIGGLILYVASTVIYLDVLSKVPLSYIYPMMSFAYVIGLLAAKLFLHEQISGLRWAGVLIICLGIYLISRS